MSRAFVKETDETFDSLPDRPVSKHPNLVTSAGFEQIDATVARLHQERAAAQAANDRTALARIARDLRYWNSRKSTARVMHAPTDSGVVHFGCTVVIAREDGSQQSYRIVGEDEATRAAGQYPTPRPLPKR